MPSLADDGNHQESCQVATGTADSFPQESTSAESPRPLTTLTLMENLPPTAAQLPLQSLHDVMWAHSRYVSAFERASGMQDRIPRTRIPGPNVKAMEPWIIEAPLNSVEILEAILQPSHHFEIHTSRHIRRGCRTTAWNQRHLRSFRRLYHEYTRFQGHLEKDREICFICVPGEAVHTIRARLWGVFTPVRLQYMSIPWSYDGETRRLEHPWALVLHDRSEPGTIHTYENRFRVLLEKLGLSGCRFPRSLLTAGTTPLPECLWDWFAGIPGTTAALPYYTGMDSDGDRMAVADMEDDGEEVTNRDTQAAAAPCRHPTVYNSRYMLQFSEMPWDPRNGLH